jgi:hypothetical protein
MRLWQFYAWAMSAVLLFSAVGRTVIFFKKREAVTRLDIVEGWLGMLTIPALFGFAYQKPYGIRAFWVVIAVLFVGFSIYGFFTPKMKTLYRKGWGMSVASIAGMAVIGGPGLWALVMYAFFSTALWN